VLWASEHHCDVWFDDGVPRRVPADSIRASPGPTPEPLVAVAADIRVFDALREGERVRWDRSIGVAEGYIAEKCRWGAIVVTEAGKVLAVASAGSGRRAYTPWRDPGPRRVTMSR